MRCGFFVLVLLKGAIGPVLGCPERTLRTTASKVRPVEASLTTLTRSAWTYCVVLLRAGKFLSFLMAQLQDDSSYQPPKHVKDFRCVFVFSSCGLVPMVLARSQHFHCRSADPLASPPPVVFLLSVVGTVLSESLAVEFCCMHHFLCCFPSPPATA